MMTSNVNWISREKCQQPDSVWKKCYSYDLVWIASRYSNEILNAPIKLTLLLHTSSDLLTIVQELIGNCKINVRCFIAADGFGMKDNDELALYGFNDRNVPVVISCQLKDWEELNNQSQEVGICEKN